ncbi:ATPase [Slackia equolifaciens]|uniref:ATPase n=2 Tax=Slackia equolifaciens TaxID=498718 RepID=A0A3N0B001_9ACTN|nr:ATPase [Slackia equolifaciens]
MPYQRSIVSTIKQRIEEPRRFMQIVVGPRQTGKTTAVNQAVAQVDLPCLFAEATKNESTQDWIKAQWYRARNLFASQHRPVLLVVDEVQFIRGWPAAVKTLWDEDTSNRIEVKVVLTGSSATLIHDGLNESLMGRFELIHSPHWSYSECADAFGYDLDDYLYYGGYPGAASLKDDEGRWLNYVRNSIIEPSIANDVLQLADVRKPELMRRLFEVGTPYSGQEVSYRKLLGQLDDKGNAATIAHYVSLLSRAGLMSGLQKYDPKLIREKASSPRLVVHNTALMVAEYGRRRKALLTDPSLRGHLVESAVGAYLINRASIEGFSVFWWRDGNDEVDYVIADKDAVTAIEVRSGRVKPTNGMTRFLVENPHAHPIIIGSTGCGIEEFLRGEIELFG